MGYDISLKDPVTKEEIELPVKHLMTGSTYAADYDPNTGRFAPKPTSEAHLGITYNYSNYYYDAVERDVRFYGNLEDDDEREKEQPRNLGIRGIYGKSGAESIPMLQDMIRRITEKYQKDGEWIITERTKTRYIDADTGGEIDLFKDVIEGKRDYRKEEYTVQISEAPNTDYWEATAGNAIKPLHYLIAMAQLRPDGIWEGD